MYRILSNNFVGSRIWKAVEGGFTRSAMAWILRVSANLEMGFAADAVGAASTLGSGLRVAIRASSRFTVTTHPVPSSKWTSLDPGTLGTSRPLGSTTFPRLDTLYPFHFGRSTHVSGRAIRLSPGTLR